MRENDNLKENPLSVLYKDNKTYIILTCSNLEEEYRVKQIIEDNNISNLATIINE
jgi:hypothetical protein